MDIQLMEMEENKSKTEIPNFGLLPILAIRNIYKFLDHADIKAASTTCSSWRIASQCASISSYISNTVINLHSSTNIKLFIEYYSTTVFKNFHISATDTKHLKMLANSCISSIIHELTIESVSLNNEFGEILNQFVNLKKLTIIQCVLDKTTFSMKEMPNVVSLTLINIKTCAESESDILNLVSVFPNLEFFKLKLLSPSPLDDDSKRRFEGFLISLISRLPDTLKEFHSILNKSGFVGFSLSELPFKSSHLTKLTLQNYILFTESCFTRLIESQKNLIYLYMPNFESNRNTNIIRALITNLPLLEGFICKKRCDLYYFDIRLLSNLKRLRTIDISSTNIFVDFVDVPKISDIIAAKENRILEELHLANLAYLLKYEDIVTCITNLPNLKVLNLDYSLLRRPRCIIDNTILQLIANNLKNLQVLSLKHSRLITNESLIGTDNVSIRSLKNLKSLHLSENPNINDDTLIYGLKFISLKELTLNKCNNITEKGLKALSYNCPSIQKLNLHNCKGIRDKAAYVILENFHRLKSLNIRECNFHEHRLIEMKIKERKIKNYRI